MMVQPRKRPTGQHHYTDLDSSHHLDNLHRPPLETRSVSFRKLEQIKNSAFSDDLKDISNALLNVMDTNQLVGDYKTELKQLLDRHAL